MDFTMDSSTEGNVNSFPTWDFAVFSGIVPFISGDPGQVQAAEMAAFIQLGSIPQLPGLGVPWAEFLTKSVTFGDLDAAIRQSAFNAGVANFVPSYDFVNAKLVVTMQATKQAGI